MIEKKKEIFKIIFQSSPFLLFPWIFQQKNILKKRKMKSTKINKRPKNLKIYKLLIKEN